MKAEYHSRAGSGGTRDFERRRSGLVRRSRYTLPAVSNGWSQVFTEVRSDLDHIWSARGASEKENTRPDRTKEAADGIASEARSGPV